jgi:hypothetical protein
MIDPSKEVIMIHRGPSLYCAALAAIVAAAAGASPRCAAAPAKDNDPLLIGSKWAGKLTQRGTFSGGGAGPPEFDIVLVITKRDNNAFEAELREKTPSLKITYLVKGEVARTADGKGYALKFQSYDSKDVESTTPILGIPYFATLSGKVMKGSWKLTRADEEIDIAGDFALERTK